jgi:hypothetical protein
MAPAPATAKGKLPLDVQPPQEFLADPSHRQKVVGGLIYKLVKSKAGGGLFLPPGSISQLAATIHSMVTGAENISSLQEGHRQVTGRSCKQQVRAPK